MIKLKRVYEKPAKADGLRILVERLWPRGFTKQQAGVDVWMKELAPSPELRNWFFHDPAKWEQFCQRYWVELDKKKERIEQLKQHTGEGVVTFVYSARDDEHNSAVALKMFLEGRQSA